MLRGQLQHAIQKANIGKIQGAVARGAPLEALFDLGFGSAGNCLDWACTCGKPEVVPILLQMADERSIGSHLALEAHQALFWAVSQGYTEVLQLLLERGADISRTAPGQDPATADTALRVAVVGSRKAETALLLQYKAWDLESDESKEQLLALAARRRSIAEAFQEAGIGDFDAFLAPLELPFREHGIWGPHYPKAPTTHWEQEFAGTEAGGV